MEWKELKWYKADKDYSFSFVKALVKTKSNSYQIRSVVKKGDVYIPIPLLEDLIPKGY